VYVPFPVLPPFLKWIDTKYILFVSGKAYTADRLRILKQLFNTLPPPPSSILPFLIKEQALSYAEREREKESITLIFTSKITF
jgi:hypothetical protein